MADITKRADLSPSLASQTNTPENQIDGVIGGSEVIDYGDLCYLHSDGTFRKALYAGGGANSTTVYGIAANRNRPGKPLTLYKSIVFAYSEDIVPGQKYYLSAVTAGALSDTPNGKPVAYGGLRGEIHFEANWDK